MPTEILILKCKECDSDGLDRKRRKIVLYDIFITKNYIENQEVERNR
ncbi:MAG: hypothetical protein ACPKPY_09450 [Nitrososphaeraceae archaeon]